MPEAFKSHCPFEQSHNERVPPPSSASGKMEEMLAFIGREDFICTIGTLLAKAGSIKQTTLTPLAPSESYIPQFRSAVKDFTARGTGAWVVHFPSEPKDYPELVQMKTKVLAHFLATVMMQDAWDKIGKILQFTQANRDKLGNGELPQINEPAAMDSKTFFGLLAEFIAPNISAAAKHFEATLAQFSEKLVTAIPNAYPTLNNSRSLQLIVMSPLFHQEQAVKCPVTDAYQINHGRYSPTTCLVVTFLDEVNKSRTTELGKATSNNVERATLVYNEYATESGAYRPSDILTCPFEMRPEKPVDEYLMTQTDEILAACETLRNEREMLAEQIAQLPEELQAKVIAAGGDQSAQDFVRVLSKLTKSLLGRQDTDDHRQAGAS